MQARRTRTCPGGSTRRPRPRPAARTAPGTAPSAIEPAVTPSTSTSASTATGRPSTTISGLRSADDDRRVGLGRSADRPTSTSTSASRSTAGSPRNAPEQRLGARGRRSSRRRRARVIGTSRKATSATRLGEDAADAEHHGHAELRVVGAGRRSAPGCPRSIGATSSVTSPSSGRGRGQELRGRRRRPRRHRRGRAARAPARSCGRWRRRRASATTGIADGSAAAATASAAVGDQALVGERARRSRRAAPSSRPRRGCGMEPAYGSGPWPEPAPARGDRGVLRAAVVLGRPRRRDGLVRRAGHDATTCTRPRTTRSTGSAWRELYDPDELAASRRFAAGGDHRLGFAISPGLSIDYDDPDDRTALGARSTRWSRRAPRSSCSASTTSPSAAAPRARPMPRVTTWLHEHLGDRAALALVPTEYVGIRSSPVPRRAGRRACPRTCRSGGPADAVVNDEITVADADGARRRSLGGRAPLLWDNYPVNDAVDGRPPLPRSAPGPRARPRRGMSGYLANPMVQPYAEPAPAGVDRRLRPRRGPRGRLAPYSRRPRLARLRRGLRHRRRPRRRAGGGIGRPPPRARACSRTPPPAPRRASRTRPRPGSRRCSGTPAWPSRPSTCSTASGRSDVVLGMAARWQASRRATVTVFGPRCSIRPVLGQADDGTWRVDPAAVTTDANAVDELVRLALARL